MSDARRQLFLRTFASTGGDMVRAAKLLGVGAEEVRQELRAIVDGASVDDRSDVTRGAEPVDSVAAPNGNAATAPRATAVAGAKKVPPKKR